MITIPVLSTTEAITHALAVMSDASELKSSFEIKVFTSDTETDSFLRNNSCELVILDFTSPDLRCEDFYNRLQKDTTLKYLNILVIVADEGERMALEMELCPNLLLCVNEREFLRNCTRYFKIFSQNIQFLYNKLLQYHLGINGAGTFVCDNDSADIVIYADMLVTYLTNTSRIDMDGKFLLQTSLMEMLLNALEHGNCGITYDEKSRWLESGHDILELIANRNRQPEISSKKITIDYNACEKDTSFCIKDEGIGFDWRAMLEKDIQPDLHGMGIKMTERMVQHLAYNEKGNEVYFTIGNSPHAPEFTEKDLKIDNYKQGETLNIEGSSPEKLAFLIDGAITGTFPNSKKIEYLPRNIFIPLFKRESEGAVFEVAKDSKLLVIERSLVDNFFAKETPFKTLFETCLKVVY
ncbi:MAG: ATP-binding protein [Spirochaetaceae bacterium]|nr:ATP-binding protein [Spirochaetaceae bacterium]